MDVNGEWRAMTFLENRLYVLNSTHTHGKGPKSTWDWAGNACPFALGLDELKCVTNTFKKEKQFA